MARSTKHRTKRPGNIVNAAGLPIAKKEEAFLLQPSLGVQLEDPGIATAGSLGFGGTRDDIATVLGGEDG